MRHILTLLFTSLTLLSCNNKKENAETTTQNESLVTRYFDHFNKHEWKELADMYADSATFKDPSLGNGIVTQTRQQIIEKYTALGRAFPDVQDKLVKVYPSGENHLIAEFLSTGTAPDNSKFELPICTIFTIEKGKITQDFTYYDNF